MTDAAQDADKAEKPDGANAALHPLLQRPLVVPLLQAIGGEARAREEREEREGQAGRASAAGPATVSLPRLSKRLGVSASVVLRELTLLGDAALGGIAGPGWVRVEQDEGRWRVALTASGQALAQQFETE